MIPEGNFGDQKEKMIEEITVKQLNDIKTVANLKFANNEEFVRSLYVYQEMQRIVIDKIKEIIGKINKEPLKDLHMR
jgi:hypothetical protein